KGSRWLAAIGGIHASTADRFSRAEREATDKDRETAEERLLGVVEQVVAPVDRVAHRLLPQGQITRTTAEQWQSLLQALQQRRRGQDFDAGGRELDREREPVDPADDGGNRWQRFRGEVEIRSDRLCPLHKEPD